MIILKKDRNIILAILDARSSEMALGRNQFIDINNSSFQACVIREYRLRNDYCKVKNSEITDMIVNEKYFKKEEKDDTYSPLDSTLEFYYSCK